MYKYVQGILGFSKREMNGVLVCILLILFFLFIPGFYTQYYASNDDNPVDQIILDSLIKEFEAVRMEAEPIAYFAFDPNFLPADSLALLGVPEYLATRIERYRLAGGHFYKKEDLMKIYGMEKELYEALSPFMKIPSVASRQTPNYQPKKVSTKEVKPAATIPEKKLKEERVKIDLNTADTTTLKSLYGIGSVYANRIVKYRALLGGFVRKEQLREVYGISDSLYYTLANRVLIQDAGIKRLRINLASFKEVNAHPYISYEQTKEIFNSKSAIGKYKSAQDLINLSLMDSAQVMKLLPYIDFK
jgi:competence protein ComEA